MSKALKSENTYLSLREKWNISRGKLARMVAEKDVCKTARNLKEKGFNKVLDLSCGSGQHALWFAQMGFEVHALDNSLYNLDYLKAKANAEGLKINFVHGEISNLPYHNSDFDYILAWDAISHSDIKYVQNSISEIYRILKTGGIFQGTLISKRNVGLLPGEISALYPYIDNLGKKDMVYCYNAMELVHILTGFEIIKLKDKKFQHRGPFQWRFVAEKI
jgi:ubiquinone/menaquinone biosynthesis C-methylase UbiE